MDISKRDQRAFEKGRALFEASVCSDTFQRFIENAYESYGFYEGWGQWREKDREELEKAGLNPVTINLIAPRLDALAGSEITRRTRFKYTSRSGLPLEVTQAQALSSLSMFIQDKNETSRLLTEAKHHARICGLGWHGMEEDDGVLEESTENPLEVVWDTRDRTQGMTNQGFLARVKWMTRGEAQRKFPGRADMIASAADNQLAFTSGLSLNSNWGMYRWGGYYDEKEDEIAVVEFQYRQAAKYWTYTTDDGLLIQTFDKTEAEENASDKKLIQEDDGFKVYFLYFSGDIFLDHFEYEYQMNPAKGWFTLTPIVYARSQVDGVPIGVVERAKDPQRLYNLKQAKINWLLAARQVIMDKDAVDSVQKLRHEINKPNAVIIKNPGKNLTLDKHENEIAQHYQAQTIHKQEIQDAMGVYDEQLGMQTNATSGKAINLRQNASQATQILGTDRMSEGVRRVARKHLAMMRSIYTAETAFYVTDDEGEVQQMQLNKTEKGSNGKARKVLDVRTGSYNVEIDVTPDVSSQNDEAREKLFELVQSNPNLVLNPMALRLMVILLNIPMTKAVKEIFDTLQLQQAQQGQQQQIGEAQATPMAGGAVPAVQPPNGMSVNG